MSIVYFDSEGDGVSVIARNFLEFIQVPMISNPYDDWRPEHYADVIYIFNEKSKLEIPKKTDAIHEACKPFQEEFDQWKNQYLN